MVPSLSRPDLDCRWQLFCVLRMKLHEVGILDLGQLLLPFGPRKATLNDEESYALEGLQHPIWHVVQPDSVTQTRRSVL